MYLHLGQNTVVHDDDIVGVFDLDITSQSLRTRQYLNRAEKQGEVTAVTDDIPKSFVITAPRKKRGTQRVYISQLSTATLLKRSESGELG
jgi:extracellular matrix regulatory protein B